MVSESRSIQHYVRATLSTGKKQGRISLPCNHQLVIKPALLRAEVELAAYELNPAQTHTQQGDGGAAVRHAHRVFAEILKKVSV